MFCVNDHQQSSRNHIFNLSGFTRLLRLWWIFCIFQAIWGGERALNDIWSRCAASLSSSGNQRPPECYTSNVVRRRGGRRGRICSFGPGTSRFSPTPSTLADGGEYGLTLWSTSALATHWANTSNICHSVLLLTATFFSSRPLLPPFLFWQAGVGLIILCMTGRSLTLIRYRLWTAILWFPSTSLTDVWWWHIWQKPSKVKGLGSERTRVENEPPPVYSLPLKALSRTT